MASPVYAGTPVLDTQIDFPSSMYPGDSGSLSVLVSEISGSDWAKDVTVSIKVSPSSGVVMESSTKSVSRIEKASSKQFIFPLELTDTAKSGTRTISVRVKYYEMDLLDINTFGPYYTEEEQDFTIKNPYGKISVSTTPSNAEIYLDGEYLGTSPMTIPNVEQGKHTVLLKKDGYNEVSTSVSVTVDSESFLSKTLTQKTGSVSISTIPSNAEIYLDGEYLGTSPMTIPNVEQGKYTVLLKKDGYNEVITSVSVTADSENFLSKTLTQKTGSVSISTNPTGSQVTIDGRDVGVSPLAVDDLTLGSHIIALSRNDYRDVSDSFYIKAGSKTTYFKTLIKESGNIAIDSTPSGACVYIKGAYKGVTPLTVEGLSPDTYSVSLSKEGYKDLQSTVTVKDGSTASVSVSMERLGLIENTVSKLSGIPANTSISLSSAQSSNGSFSLGIILAILVLLIVLGFSGKKIKKGKNEMTHVDNQTVINNIHYGNKIETNIKDSVVQRSNFGSNSFPCPYCGSEVAAGEQHCPSCGKKIVDSSISKNKQ